MEQKLNQIKLPQLLIEHFYVGVAITLFYVLLSEQIIQMGYPGLLVLLMAEIVILTPLVALHFSIKARKKGVKIRNLINYTEQVPLKRFLFWTFIGIAGCILIYAPLYPIGQFFRTNVFGWLPEWYFNPSYGTDNIRLIANVFLMGIFIDGIVGPVCEEFFFRGYLLPRMAWLRNWAPVVNGALFGIYHFWQPHNIVGTMAVGIIISSIVWKNKNVYLGIAIHCALNLLGALGGYIAVLEGVIVGR